MLVPYPKSVRVILHSASGEEGEEETATVEGIRQACLCFKVCTHQMWFLREGTLPQRGYSPSTLRPSGLTNFFLFVWLIFLPGHYTESLLMCNSLWWLNGARVLSSQPGSDSLNLQIILWLSNLIIMSFDNYKGKRGFCFVQWIQIVWNLKT